MKHFLFSYLITLFLISVILVLIIWIVYPIFLSKQRLNAPLPSYLDMGENNQVTTTDLWLPGIENTVVSDQKKPQIEAEAALVYDLTTGQTLFAKNPRKKVPMASLTKIMTAIISLESAEKDDRYEVLKKSLVGEDTMGLSEGEALSLEELLYGLMLPSGNDAAEVLANNFIDERENFVLAMNNKAKSLGLINTNFTNSTGLEGDGKQFTTAYDLLVITNYALKNFPLFRKVVATFSYEIPQTRTHKAYYLENETNLLTSYPGVLGVKTGYTPEANLCLVTYLNFGGHRIIGVLLGSNNRREEMKELLDYSLKTLGVTPPPHE